VTQHKAYLPVLAGRRPRYLGHSKPRFPVSGISALFTMEDLEVLATFFGFGDRVDDFVAFAQEQQRKHERHQLAHYRSNRGGRA
jgi:hypothetical protein